MCDQEQERESLSQSNTLDCWDYSIDLECLQNSEDLQLAAELGKTLLERNKELETTLKKHQNIIEDQTQEIEYLSKQTVALREVNDSRMRIYEQLEVSIHDLERANHRLALDNTADKKQIKNLCANVSTLESKCDEFQSTIDDLKIQLNANKRKCQRETESMTATLSRNRVHPAIESKTAELSNDKEVQCDDSRLTQQPTINTVVFEGNEKSEHITRLTEELGDIKNQRIREKRRVTELEEQLSALVQENQALENQLINQQTTKDDTKSMHEEFTSLYEVRQGQLCSRCLQSADERLHDDLSILDPEEDDDSMIDALIGETRYHSSVSINIQKDSNQCETQSKIVNSESNNLYRDLVEKYEALVAVNRNHNSENSMSLQEELQLCGNFINSHAKYTDEEIGHCDSLHYKNMKNANERKTFSLTPTDFSEAETSSSGFADETSNKSTQTDGRPGSFLCTIADGEDCKFSIYDDASPIDSRFRNRPEYKELFKEIFTVLKKAAENKDEGEELPLLDDCTNLSIHPKDPPVTPSTEYFPADFTDDNHSILSYAMSDDSTCVTESTTLVECLKSENVSQENGENENTIIKKEDKALVLTPYKREPLEYLSVAVNVRKKAYTKKNSKKQSGERSGSPVLPLSPKISYLSNSQRKKKENRSNVEVDSNQLWSGASLQFWSSNRNTSPIPTQTSNKNYKYEKNSVEFKPSSASHDLSKLKRLDLSYAEVLRNASNKKREALAKSLPRK